MSEMETETLDESEVPEGNELDLGLLIDTIQNYEYLYNLSHTNYKDIKKKNLAWEEIAMILNSTVETCQKQWKALRDKFVRETKRKSGSAAPESDWTYFKQMLFYTKYTKPRKTYCTTKPAIKKIECSESRPSSAASAWSTMESILSPTTSLEEDETYTTPTTTPSTSKGKAGTKKRKADADIEGVMEVAKKICSTLTESGSKVNANAKFGEYVSARLDEMTPEEAKEKRKAMLLILEQQNNFCFGLENIYLKKLYWFFLNTQQN